MGRESRKLLTVVTEHALEKAIIEEIRALGASGYTVTDARGAGSRGVRDAGWSSSSNIRIEIICDAELADRMADRLEERFYADYAMVLFISDVLVLRPGKFV